MTAQDLEAMQNELSRLSAELNAAAGKDGNDGLKVLAGIGAVMANLGKLVAEMKGQVEEVTARERARDRGPIALRDERSIHFLAELHPEVREQLVRTIETTVPNVSLYEFGNAVAQATRLYNWQVNELVLTLASWYGYLGQRESEEDVNRVVAILTDPYNLVQTTAALLNSVEAGNGASLFSQQLKRLLRCHTTLGITAKAEQLVRRNERQYVSAVVSSDLRPIFGGNVQATPIYAVVIHNLVLSVNEGGTARSIGISLTSADILNLAAVFDRAWKKEQTLKSHSPYKFLPLG